MLKRTPVDNRITIFLVHAEKCMGFDELNQYLRDTHNHISFISLSSKLKHGESIPRELEKIASSGDAAIVFASPEDTGKRKNESTYTDRARQNIWLELGWFWGRLGLDRTLIINNKKIEMPSDTLGILTAEYEATPLEAAEDINRFINQIRYNSEKHTNEIIYGTSDSDSRILQFQSVVRAAKNTIAVSGIGRLS